MNASVSVENLLFDDFLPDIEYIMNIVGTAANLLKSRLDLIYAIKQMTVEGDSVACMRLCFTYVALHGAFSAAERQHL